MFDNEKQIHGMVVNGMQEFYFLPNINILFLLLQAYVAFIEYLPKNILN